MVAYTQEPIPISPGNVVDDEDQGHYESLSDKHTNCQDKEKQISVDPLSVKPKWLPPPPLPPPKSVSYSLPGSAVSSPTNSSSALSKQPKKHNSRFAWEATNSLRRSKSRGEGRTSWPSVDIEFIDILSRRPSISAQNGDQSGHAVEQEASDDWQGKSVNDGKFTCGCLFLSSLSHKKKQEPMWARAPALILDARVIVPLPQAGVQDVRASADLKCRVSTVSKAASLEKFSCESWSPSAMLESDDGWNSYFDLPLELIRGGVDETDSPVRAAFVFDREVKGVLKKSSSNVATSRKSQASSSNRHVRFSTSAPTSYPASPASVCITPRLRKAREECNEFLAAAQNA